MEMERDRRQASEYAMALDLLAQIAQVDTEEEAVEKILELFTILFAPNKLYYCPLMKAPTEPGVSCPLSAQDEAFKESLVAGSSARYAWTASGQGFMVKICHKASPLGIMVVDDLAHPEYKKHYLNLSLSMTDVCGLAIENAKRYQQLKNSEDRLRQEKERAEAALAEVKTLSGLLPICSYCKKIRDDKGYWNQIETYIHEHSDAEFSHSICRDCADKYFPEMGLYDD